MTTLIRRIAGTSIVTCGVVVVLWVGVYMRFKNPDWTDTRLLLETWPEDILALVLIFGWLIIRG